MPTRPILVAPHPLLKTPAAVVDAVDAGVHTLLDDMLETMYDAPGIGLAAPQIGVSRRLVVLDVAGKDEPRSPLCLINPEVEERSTERSVGEEGCLSLPEIFADVERPSAVTVRYLDRDGQSQTITANGLLARCLQHEIDHLDGVLFVDHLSMLRRKMLLRKLAKLQRAKPQRGED
ncbi:MAG: peptide deformylase [Pseudomonadota bacterium]